MASTAKKSSAGSKSFRGLGSAFKAVFKAAKAVLTLAGAKVLILDPIADRVRANKMKDGSVVKTTPLTDSTMSFANQKASYAAELANSEGSKQLQVGGRDDMSDYVSSMGAADVTGISLE